VPDEGRLGSVARRLAATQRVLSVEDEHDIADFLRAYFRASGYDLVHIDPETPLEVLEAIDEHQPDLVLLDLGLRGFSGDEAYRLIRTDERYAFMPVIVVSARHDAAQVVDTAGGIDAVVIKPFNVNTLAELVAERITTAQALRDKGRDNNLDLLSQDYVEARLTDEVVIGGIVPVSFALVRLRSLHDIVQTVGDDGTTYVVQSLVRQARDLLPASAVLGLTRTDELAIVLPGCRALDATQMMTDALDAIADTVTLPGGAEVDVRIAAGLAGYPDHAADADGLYMAADSALADACEGEERLVVAI
jgi:CheY-like chemotaxis protein